MNYSNPTTERTIDDWPYGAQRTTAHFYIETVGNKQRACRVTINPKTGLQSAVKKTTFARRMKIVDGDDGRTYILADAAPYGFLRVMHSNMKYLHESIFETDPRFNDLLALINGTDNTGGYEIPPEERL